MEHQSLKSRASLSRGRGESQCAIFYHPLILTEFGKPKRVRYGLGTADKELAAKIVDDINKILADTGLWHPEFRRVAEQRFLPVAVECFYDGIVTKVVDPWTRRNEALPLPEGGAAVQFVGPTGSGKTTALRQIMGTDPTTEHFPATSPSRTTIFDTEIICEEGDFKAVVSFISEAKARLYVEECVHAAVSKAAEEFDREAVLRALLVHGEERFRLAYILGNLSGANEEEEDDDGDDYSQPTEGEGSISDQERATNRAMLEGWLDRCIALARDIRSGLEAELGEEAAQMTDENRDVFLQLLDLNIRDSEQIESLVDELIDAVQSRFDFIKDGKLTTDKGGWPSTWSLESKDRPDFLKSVRRFSGNSASQFGRLLTPLVDGLRVRGPFMPTFLESGAKMAPLVLFDGEGVGHVRSTSAQVPTSVSRRYSLATMVVLIDSAASPMQAGAQAVLRSVAASGHEQKLAIVFTHVDLMRGSNFNNPKDKRDALFASLEQAIQGVDEAMGLESGAGRKLRRRLVDHVFFVGGIDKALREGRGRTVTELQSLYATFQKSALPPAPLSAVPVYDPIHLVLGLRSAADTFQSHWDGLLGLSYHEGVSAEHWKRIEALARRFAFQSDDKYKDLQPVAHLLSLLTEKLAVFVSNPRSWEPPHASIEAKDAATAAVAKEFSDRLGTFVRRRFCEDHLRDWAEAYARSGRGSGRTRSRDIHAIHAEIAPVPGDTPSTLVSRLLDDVRALFQEAVTAAGAKIATL